MYTQCPQCLTIYEIDEDALQASLGIVHCGRCDERFDALRTLSDTLPVAPLTPLPERDPSTRAPTLTEAVPPAAYESSAHRQRSRRNVGADDNQHQLALSSTVSAEPQDTDNPPAKRPADDWFAQFESELTDSVDATALPTEPALAAMHADADDVDLPSHDAVMPPSDRDENWLESQTPDRDEATPPNVATESPQETANAINPLDESDACQVAMQALPSASTAPASVVSPRLLEGDVFDETADLDALLAETPAGTSAEATPATTADEDAATTTTPEATNVAEPTDASVSEQEPSATAADDTTASAPVYVRPRQRFLSGNALAWSAGCLLLAMLLAMQLAWASRVELMRDPSTRAWTQRVCTSIPCRLPPIKDVALLELLSRDVRPDPSAPGALTITATIRNNASFRQPWPIVLVELTDFDNHAVAMRRFRPAEYMPDAARRAAGIAPGATAAVAFEVADPGKRAGGYRFGFE